jgi:sorbitol-6-phosphate 2-dehydrogenase
MKHSVKNMVADIVRTCGGIDLFVSNAGVLKAGSVKTLSAADFRFVTEVNYTGFFLCTKHVAPVMEAMNKPTGKYFHGHHQHQLEVRVGGLQ